MQTSITNPQGWLDPQNAQSQRVWKLKSFTCQELIEQITSERVCCKKLANLPPAEKQKACMLCYERLQSIKADLVVALGRDNYLKEVFERWFENISKSLAEILWLKDPLGEN